MFPRFLLVFVALVVGVVVASVVPDVSRTAQTALSFMPLLELAQFSAQQPTTPPKADIKDAHSGGKDDGHGAGGTEKGEGKEGAIKLSDDQISAAKIEIAKTSDGTLTRRLTVPGTVTPAANRIGRVAAKVVGTVADLNKQLGDTVAKGEVVAVVDSREVADAKSEYLAAQVNFELQKTLFERSEMLFQKNITAEQQFLRARTNFTEVQLRFDLARQKLMALGVPDSEIAGLSRESTALQRYELRAPLAGRVIERLVSLGSAVGGEGQPKELYGIADLSRVWVELAVSPRDLSLVKEGQVVQITAGGMSERADGKIVFKSPVLNAETRSARVVAQIANKDGVWQPGAFVTAEIVVEEQKAPLVVPKTALQTVDKDQVLFVRTPKGFEKRVVATGRSDGQSTEIEFGLDPGEEIAITNTFTLKAELGKSEASHAH